MALIEVARDVTGEPFFFEPKDVSNQTVNFTGTISVPRDRFLPFFDWCLRQVDFIHLEQIASGVTLHRLEKLGRQSRAGSLRSFARDVTNDELRAMRDRGTLVTTTCTAKDLPVWDLVVTLQLYFADSETESIRTIDGTNSIVMTGFANNLAGIIDLVDRLDVIAAADPVLLRRKEQEEHLDQLQERVQRLEQAEAARSNK
jgi:type II secretory pathway component GspD/PulD (secretin)